jgi:hypothetical protein
LWRWLRGTRAACLTAARWSRGMLVALLLGALVARHAGRVSNCARYASCGARGTWLGPLARGTRLLRGYASCARVRVLCAGSRLVRGFASCARVRVLCVGSRLVRGFASCARVRVLCAGSRLVAHEVRGLDHLREVRVLCAGRTMWCTRYVAWTAATSRPPLSSALSTEDEHRHSPSRSLRDKVDDRQQAHPVLLSTTLCNRPCCGARKLPATTRSRRVAPLATAPVRTGRRRR